MLEQIIKMRTFYVPKGKSADIIFVSDFSRPFKVHTVKIKSGDYAKYIYAPCSSGASGELPCVLCQQIKSRPDYVFSPSKIYAATIYQKLNEPWEDENKVVHYYFRRAFIGRKKQLDASVGPYVNKYGTLRGASFSISRGIESKNGLGDIFNLAGYLSNVDEVIREKAKALDFEEMFAPLSKEEINEVITLSKMAEETDRVTPYSSFSSTDTEEDIPF